MHITEAILIGLFFQSISYGIFLVSFALCLSSLLWGGETWQSSRDVNWRMVGVSGIFFALSTFDWGLEMVYTIDTFVIYDGPGGAEESFLTVSDWSKVANVSLTCTARLKLPLQVN